MCEDYDECLARAIDHTAESLNVSAYTTSSSSSYTSTPPAANSFNTSTPGNVGNFTTAVVYVTTPEWRDMVQPNTALLTMTLTVFTFVLAYYLKGLRNKKLLGRTVSDELCLYVLKV